MSKVMRVSWTKFSAYQNCALQYNLIYQMRVPGIKPRLPFLSGLVVHDSVKAWVFRGYPPNFIEKVAAAIFRQYSMGMKFSHKGVYFKLLRRSIAGAYMAARIYLLLQFPSHKALVEEWFKIPFGKGIIIGGVDVYDPFTKILYDLKMHVLESDTSDKGQLKLYTLSQILRNRDPKKMGFICPLKLNKVQTEPIDMEELKVFEKKLKEAIEHMMYGVEPKPNEGRHCYFCRYKNTVYCPTTLKNYNEKEG